uniref:Uncharacterized protein n=1 Tax=Nelumbo nucifera TaxID=4432 RepID=A0A822ZNX0_NELNU|nr:TPA_asm: hypothetical protein HUJ06_003461 [Nelumbo nucifera]
MLALGVQMGPGRSADLSRSSEETTVFCLSLVGICFHYHGLLERRLDLGKLLMVDGRRYGDFPLWFFVHSCSFLLNSPFWFFGLSRCFFIYISRL